MRLRLDWVPIYRTKIKVSGGENLLQKSARESGKVAEIEILARIIRQI